VNASVVSVISVTMAPRAGFGGLEASRYVRHRSLLTDRLNRSERIRVASRQFGNHPEPEVAFGELSRGQLMNHWQSRSKLDWGRVADNTSRASDRGWPISRCSKVIALSSLIFAKLIPSGTTKRPDLLRIYNRIAESMRGAEGVLYSAMASGAPAPVVTRIERQCSGRARAPGFLPQSRCNHFSGENVVFAVP
jgi:hypothetical protein